MKKEEGPLLALSRSSVFESTQDSHVAVEEGCAHANQPFVWFQRWWPSGVHRETYWLLLGWSSSPSSVSCPTVLF